MTRDRARRASRITGHIAWWVYVIAAVFGLCIADRYGSTMPRRYADYLTTDIGWTAYTPLEDFTPSGAGSSSTAFFGGLALVAGAVVLVAAVAEAAWADGGEAGSSPSPLRPWAGRWCRWRRAAVSGTCC
ncbi:hypothetical protein MYK68_12445 [Gordonia sp. PP30]|uniref:hypothetical protein n=1 Tax=Gordonia sp. PP30 TaxID=2935861 RepID=UPI001FFECE0F|nr:hypothetical protein [Gordonia sp. PP30]UQE73559.1 hypothetical protein MYK68_12445 [Gordonia sp. PP30]